MRHAARGTLTTTTGVDVCVNEIRKLWTLACRVRLDVEVGDPLSSFLRCDALVSITDGSITDGSITDGSITDGSITQNHHYS